MSTSWHDKPFSFTRNTPLVGGIWLQNTSLGARTHVNPASGKVQAEVFIGGEPEIDLAVTVAAAGQQAWIAMPPQDRMRCFRRLADLLAKHDEEFTWLAAKESGIAVQVRTFALAQAWLDYYAGWIDKLDGSVVDSFPMPGTAFIRPEPYGVIGVIIPWNCPNVAIAMTVMPAIAAGNSVVLKPPSLAPFVALRWGELALEAGFPSGVLNVVPGDQEAGNAMVAHPGIGKISFTGGEQVARQVIANSAATLKPLSLELGGKSANILFDDADLDAAIPLAVYMGTVNLSGQGCVNPTRLLVQRGIYDKAVSMVTATAEAIRVGDPLDPETNMGPVIGKVACERILGVIERAVLAGEGRLASGGKRLGGELAKGFFIPPTVFVDVKPGSSLAQDEIFGPVLSVIPFDTDEEAIAIANGTRYGLGAYLHTRNIDRARQAARRLDAGYISINGFSGMTPTAPFGGYKQSGYGRAGGRAGLDEYLQSKTVFVGGRQF